MANDAKKIVQEFYCGTKYKWSSIAEDRAHAELAKLGIRGSFRPTFFQGSYPNGKPITIKAPTWAECAKMNPRKKKRTPKQIAAFKKMRAGLAKWQKKTGRKVTRKRKVTRRRNPCNYAKTNPKSRRVVIKGDKFKVARTLADAGIPFIFVRQTGGNTVGDVPSQHISKLRTFLTKRPALQGRFARYTGAPKRLAKNPKRKRSTVTFAKHKYKGFIVASLHKGRTVYWNGKGYSPSAWGTHFNAATVHTKAIGQYIARKSGRRAVVAPAMMEQTLVGAALRG